ncbi:MAG: hypothetical protein H7Y38_00900 [Armatimonadetes bacterium]|nr:hypothetical protein [Armatimonadota bacterium]
MAISYQAIVTVSLQVNQARGTHAAAVSADKQVKYQKQAKRKHFGAW